MPEILPLVSVVILNWNRLEDTKLCLDSVFKLEYPNVEVIVVDNGSSEDQKQYLLTRRDIILVDNKYNRGFTGGHIDGYEKAKGEYVFLLNNDSVVSPDYLSIAVEELENNKEVGAIGGRAYFWNEKDSIYDESNPYYSYQEIDIRTGEARTLQFDYGAPQVVNNVSGSAVLVRKSVTDKVGYLYEPFFAYFEETDLFARMKRAGYKIVFHPKLKIWHRNGASSGASSGSHFFYYQIFKNRYIFALRNFEARSLWPFMRNYFSIGSTSIVKFLLGRGDNVMNAAYSQAFLVNLFLSPRWLWQRALLQAQLGASQYNRQIFEEQNGISFVLDCTSKKSEDIDSLVAEIRNDRNPLHEYVVVASSDKYSEELDLNLRFVCDRGYFKNRSINLGAIASRFPWILIADPDQIPDVDTAHELVGSTLHSHKDVIASQLSNQLGAVLISRPYFVLSGGLFGANTSESIKSFLRYALVDRKLSTKSEALKALLDSTLPEELRILSEKSQINNQLFSVGDSLLTRFSRRSHRSAQLVNLLRWLASGKISVRTKISRSLRTILGLLCLNRKKVALELRHIQNEVLIYCSEGNAGRLITASKAKALKRAEDKPEEVPVFLIAYERLDSMRNMVEWLESVGQKRIVFIDNNSSYPPLINYYSQTPYQVIRLYRNGHHTAPWTEGIVKALVPESYYIISDPDIIPAEECPRDVVSRFVKLHAKYPYHDKVGFGLKIDDLPDYFPLKKSVIDWEKQFWLHELERGVYEAGVDTTFAVYKPFTYRHQLHPSIRTGDPYLARHAPWYINPNNVSEEELYYREKADKGITSWNTDSLPDRYAKELKKQKRR